MFRSSTPAARCHDCFHFAPRRHSAAASALMRRPAPVARAGAPDSAKASGAILAAMPPPLCKPTTTCEPLEQEHTTSQRGVRPRSESIDDLFLDETPLIELEPAGDLFDDDDDDASSFSHCFVSASRGTSCSGRSVQGFCEVEVDALHVPSQVFSVARPPPGLEHLRPMRSTQTDVQCVAPCPETRTTVMLQRLPYHLTEWDVCRELDALGFMAKYDAVAVPRNMKRGENLGYAFINFVEPALAAACIEVCGGRPFADKCSGKACAAEYSKKQGSGFIYDCLRATATKQRTSTSGRAACAKWR